MADDYPDNRQTTGTVTVGGSVTGNVETNGDRDWFAVTLAAGKTYQFDLKGSGTGDGTLSDPFLHWIFDADGDRMEDTRNNDGGVGKNSRLVFTVTVAGTYYVSAGPRAGVGTYTLSVTDVTASYSTELTAWTDTTGTATVGSTATGSIDFQGDRDWFAVTLDAGKYYRFDLKGLENGDGTVRDPDLRGIHDADGNLIEDTRNNDGGPGSNSRVTFVATEDATYYVSAGASRGHTGTYKLSVADVTASYSNDLRAGTDTAGEVAVDGSASGRIDFVGDSDWFEVTLVADETYRFDLEGSGSRNLRAPYLRGIYDAAGTLLGGTTNYAGGPGNNSRVTFTPTVAGTYYVSAGAYGGRDGTYTLSVTNVTDGVPDDFTAGLDTTGSVMVGGTATGRIESDDDRDWFEVTLVAGKIYRFDLAGSWTGAGTLAHPYLHGIYDAQGNRINGTTNDDGRSYNSQVRLTATAGGTYYVSAGADRDGQGTYQGTYTLSVREVTDDFTAWIDTTGALTVGGSVTGEIEVAGDHDWFEVTLAAGTLYRFDLEVAGAEPLADPYLRGIYDAAGDLINGTTNDDGGRNSNSRVTFTPPAAGTYYVSASAHGRGAGTYALSVREITDDFTAETDTIGAVTGGGSVTGEIELAGDRDWFEVTLQAGQYYRFDLAGSWNGAGTLRDPFLRGIYNAGGNPINGTTNDDGGPGLDSRVTFAATENGTYYVSAGAYGSREGTYTLSVTDVTDSVSDDFTAGTGTTGAVTVGGRATGEIDFGSDRDWFAVTLEASKTYRFDLEGSATGADTLRDPYLYGIHNADGSLIEDTSNDDGGSGYNSRVTFTATSAGTYYVSAGAYQDDTGAYVLSVDEVM